MDLRGGHTFWPEIDGPPPAPRPLTSNETCDVAIIGGGVSGALAAYKLIAAGKEIVLLDRRPFGQGSTTASTGLLQYEIDVPLIKLSKKVGAEHASRAYRLCVRTLLEFESIVDDLQDRCRLIKRQSLFLAKKKGDVEILRQECATRQACGIAVKFLSEDALQADYGIGRPAALLSKHAAEIDPYRLTIKLLEWAQRRGLRAYTPAEVIRYEHRANHVVLHTKEGNRVAASHVIFATGYETPKFLAAGTTRLKSTYALVTKPMAPMEWKKRWRDQPLIWEMASPYFYVRSAPGHRAMIGGADDDFTNPKKRDASIPRKTVLLESKLKALFPHFSTPTERAWAGTFAETQDGLPYIGRHPKFPRGWFTLGYGGNGITFALIAANLMRKAILEKPARDLELFRFDR